jgi:hypothetical protein
MLMNNQAVNETNTNPTARAEGARAMMERIEAWRQEIPDFSLRLPSGNRTNLGRARLVPPDFVEQIGAAMTGDETLTRGGTTPDQMHDLVLYALTYGPVADEMDRLAKEMRHSVDTARVKAGTEALITFRVAERLATVPGNEHLIPMVETMRKTLRTAPAYRPGKRAKKDATDTPPQPSPAPVASHNP